MEPRLLSVFFSIVLLAAGKHKIKICGISLTDIVWGFINQHVIILALGMSFLCCFFFKFADFTICVLPRACLNGPVASAYILLGKFLHSCIPEYLLPPWVGDRYSVS